MQVPEGLKYTETHEWVRTDADSTATVGITHYAQDHLGELVYVELPQVGSTLSRGANCAVVESTKAASDVYAPVDGEVVEANDALSSAPETVNADPEGSGWFAKIRVSNPDAVTELMTKDAYDRYVAAL